MIKQLKIAKSLPFTGAVLLMLSLTFASFSSYSRDPFSPFSSSSENKKKDFSKNSASKKESKSGEETVENLGDNEEKKPSISITNPLVTAPLDNYKIAAVMLTPKEAYVVVKAPNGIQFIAKKDDRVGNEGGKITEVSIDSVKVKNGDDEVKIPVSNFVEAISSVEEKELTP